MAKPRFSFDLIASLLVGLTAACGSGPSSSDGTVGDSLDRLGIERDKSQRVAADGSPLPQDYAPLGGQTALYAGAMPQSQDAGDVAAPKGVSELFLLGVQRPTASSSMWWAELDPTSVTNTQFGTDVLYLEDAAETPWALAHPADGEANLRDAVAADFDGDGREEIAVVYRAAGESAVTLQLYQDKVASFASGQRLTLSFDPVQALHAVAGDFNGDGRAELAVALVSAGSVSLVLVKNLGAELALEARPALPFMQFLAGSQLSVRLATGNLDFDAGEELVMVVNELRLDARDARNDAALSRYYVVDDATTGFASTAARSIQGMVDGTVRTAVLADVAIGDVDRDNLGELIFAGLASLHGPGPCDTSYLMVALDDLTKGGEELVSHKLDADIHGGACAAAAPGAVRAVHVNTFDVDGDNVDEIAVNQFVFEDLVAREGPASWTVLHRIADADLFGDVGGFTGTFDTHTSATTTAEVSNDGREDLIIYSQATNTLAVWGISNTGDREPRGAGWRRLHQINVVDARGAAPVEPILLGANLDSDDTTVVRISEGSHQVVYSEPVIVAALAAAPCSEELGQSTRFCRTSYGESTTTTTGSEFSTTVTAGVSVTVKTGVDLGLIKATDEITAGIQATLGTAWKSSYAITRTVTFTTAPIEDEVIFTSIPYDIYTYDIVSHPQPELVGQQVVVALPRDLTLYKVSLDHYERNVVDGGPRIAGTVFHHTKGKPRTYRSVSEKDQLVDEAKSVTLGSFLQDLPIDLRVELPKVLDFKIFGDIVGNLDIGPVAVNPGGGHVTQAISMAVNNERSFSGRVEASLEIKVDASVLGNGGSVKVKAGVGAGASFSVIHGTGTTYSGTVADIPEDKFTGNGYRWGLFTYLHTDPKSGQQFDVVDYWVE